MAYFLQSARSTFTDWWRVLGFLSAGFSIYSSLVAAMDLTVSDLATYMLAAYREIFHGIIDGFASPFGFSLPTFAKDLTVAWLVLGGSFVRMINRVIADHYLARGSTVSGIGSALIDLADVARTVLVLIAWPVFMVLLFRAPFVYLNETESGLFSSRERLFPTNQASIETPRGVVRFEYDVRIVVLLNVLAAVTASIVLLFVGG